MKDSFFGKGAFVRMGHLDEKGVGVNVTLGSASSFTLELSSKVNFAILGSGNIPQIPGVSAAIELAFGEEGAAVISGENVTAPRISNLDAVRNGLIDLRNSGDWDLDFRLIYQVRHFPTAFLAISKSNSGKLLLGLKGTAIPTLESLGKAQVDVTVAAESGGFLKLIDAKDITPIVYAARLKRKQIGYNLVPETLVQAGEGFELVEDVDLSEEFYEEISESSRIEMMRAETIEPGTPTSSEPLVAVADSFISSESSGFTASSDESGNLTKLGTVEALVATEEGEPDERNAANDEITISLERAENPGFDLREFEEFIRSLRLRYFQPGEFLVMGGSNGNSGSGCYNLNGPPPQELWLNIVRTAQVLDELRDRLGAAIKLSSVYRNERYNSCIGGARYSQHKRFNAADFTTAEMSPREVARALFRLRSEGFFHGGIGLYRTFVHVDTRGLNADWAGSGMTLDGVI